MGSWLLYRHCIFKSSFLPSSCYFCCSLWLAEFLPQRCLLVRFCFHGETVPRTHTSHKPDRTPTSCSTFLHIRHPSSKACLRRLCQFSVQFCCLYTYLPQWRLALLSAVHDDDTQCCGSNHNVILTLTHTGKTLMRHDETVEKSELRCSAECCRAPDGF